MASKRNPGSEPIVSAGAVSPRGKGRVTRKHKSIPAETSEIAIAASPAVEPPAPSQADSPVTSPTFEEIARLAYSYWEARGYQGGSSEEDWLRAERELRSAQIVLAANA